MKKYLKLFCLCICSILMAISFSACGEEVKKIAVTQITLDKREITLYTTNNVSSSEEFVVSYKPANANQTDIEFFSYNTSLIEISAKENTGDTFVVKAKSIEVDKAQTYIGVRMKGNPDVQTSCHVIVQKVKSQLSPITNLHYNAENGRIEWDATTNTVDDGFIGYKLLINGKEYVSPQNNFFEDFSKGEKLSVRVKALSGVSDFDSNYSEELTFMVLGSVQNFKHSNGVLTWDAVEGATSYSLQINSLPAETLTETSKQVSFDSDGEYTFKITALGDSEQTTESDCTYYNSVPAYVKVTKLSAPKHFNYQKVFTWDAVVMDNDAVPLAYEVYEVLDDNTARLVATTKDLSFAVPEELQSGSHTLKVRALGDGISTISSEFTATKSINKLDAPTNLRVENGVITWDRDEYADSYKISFTGIYNGSTYYDSTYSLNTGSNQNFFEFGEMFKGDYVIKVASVSDAENTADSDFTAELAVTKLSAPSISTFAVTENKLTWQADSHASRYDIILTIGENIVTDSVVTNEYTLPASLSAGEFSYQIKLIGDNTKYLTSDYSEIAYAEKLANPEFSLVKGELNWSSVANASGYILNINGTEIDMKKQTSYSFADYASGNYNVRVKALGGNANSQSNKNLVGSFASNFSNILSLTKYMAPTLSVEDGTIKCTSSEADTPNAVIEKQINRDGSYSYKAYFPGDYTNHISSDYSATLKVWQAPEVTNLVIKNSVAMWDSIPSNFEGAKFKVTCIYADLEGNRNELDLYEGLNNSFDFSNTQTYGAGTYRLSVKIMGTSGKQGNNLILSSPNTAELNFSRLPRPTVTVTGAMQIVQSGQYETLPGTVTWNSVSVGNNSAIGYTIKIKNSSGNVIANYDMKSLRQYDFTNPAGTYTISIEAYGNGTDLLNSGFGEEAECTKLEQATNVKLDKHGNLSWSSIYNTENSGLENTALNLAGMGGMPLYLRVLFIIEIDGEYYNPYDLNDVFNNGTINYEKLGKLNSQRSVNLNDLKKFNGIDGTKIDLTHGNHTLRVISAPLNYKVETGISMHPVWGFENDIVSDATSYMNFTKLEQVYGLRVDRNDSEEYIISFTENYDANISGYELVIKTDGTQDEDDTTKTISLDGISNTSFNFTKYMRDNGITDGAYVVKVRAISSTDGFITSNYTEEVKLILLTDINLQIADGMLKWNAIENAEGYIFTITRTGVTITKEFKASQTSYALSIKNDERFIAGTYNIKVQVVGAESSNYGKVIYLNTLEAKDYGEFIKLPTPTGLEVENGVIIFNHIDSAGDLNGYNYNILITKDKNTSKETISQISNYLTSSNTIFSYELPEKYSAGDYSIKVQAKGAGYYLDGEVSDVIVPEIVKKLSATSVYINNGIINWNAVEGNGYLVKISGANFYVFSEEDGSYSQEANQNAFNVKIASGTTALDISGELMNTDGTKFKLAKGEYSVQVKVLGTNVTYLNSNFSTLKKFQKLATPTNVRIEDGSLKWNKLSGADAPNGVMIYIKADDEKDYRLPVIIKDNSITQFDFAGEAYQAGKTYSFYLRTVGDTNLDSSSFNLGHISGDATEVIEHIEKLKTPQNAKIDYVEQANTIGKYTFDKLDDSYANIEYLICVKVISSETEKEFEKTISTNEFLLSSEEIEGVKIGENTQIEIKAKTLGNTNYISSEFTDTITIIIPPSPILTVVEDEDGRFTGKVTWSQVQVGDFETTYVLKYQFLDIDTATALNIKSASEVTEEIWTNTATESILETTKLFQNICGKGYYRFKVIACVKGHDTIKSTEQDYSTGYDFCLFSSGEGTEENPFIIDSAQTFNFISYNLSAHYKLSANIDFAGITIANIGSAEEKFTGSVNGNNKIITNINISNVAENSSIFDYVGKDGKIYDLIVNYIVITNGTNVGGLVGKNEGTISNITLGAVLSGSDASYDGVSEIKPYSVSILNSYVGGIVGYNLGTIQNCKNYAFVTPRNDNAEVISGGIAGYNAGVITNCVNYNTVGGLDLENDNINSNMSGGIAGFNEKQSAEFVGLITQSANYASVLASSRNKNGVSQSGYAGGIVGYALSGTITKCFNDNSNGVYETDNLQTRSVIYSTTTFSNMYVYVGGIVGYNENGSVVTENSTISNIQFNTNGTSAQTYIGVIIGQNNGKTIRTVNNLYGFALETSSVTTAGEIMPTGANIIIYVQGESADKTIEKFIDTTKRVLQ